MAADPSGICWPRPEGSKLEVRGGEFERGGVRKTGLCYTSNPVPVSVPVPVPTCTLLLAGSWSGAEGDMNMCPWERSAVVFVISRTGMPQTVQPLSHYHKLRLELVRPLKSPNWFSRQPLGPHTPLGSLFKLLQLQWCVTQGGLIAGLRLCAPIVTKIFFSLSSVCPTGGQAFLFI